MGFFSNFERKVEDGVEGAASKLDRSDLSPVQITKKAEKQMKREKMVGNGRTIAPTLYTCLVSEEDDQNLFGYYPTLAGEVETYLVAKAQDYGYSLDCKPLVRFVPDPELKRGKFDVIAELVAPPTVDQLRKEENERYGIASQPQAPVREKPAPEPVSTPASQSVAKPIKQGAESPRLKQQIAQNAGGMADLPKIDGEDFSNAPSAPVDSAPKESVPSISVDEVESIANEPESASVAENAVAPAAAAAASVAAPLASAAARPSVASYAPAKPPVVEDKLAGFDVFTNTPSADYTPSSFSQEAQAQPQVQAPSPVQANKKMEVYLYDEENDIAYKLNGAPERIGRESSNDIVISDINASRVHAEIHMEPNGTWIISDLGSTNGLYVNGRRVKSAPLNDADIVLIGTTRLEFQNL